ncbi:MAG: HAD hydrolase family protein [Pseudomonadota bacterium]
MTTTPQFLIALDLDGTSVRYEPRLEMDSGLMQYIASLRSCGIVWAMNSDRYTDTMADIASLLPPEERPAAILSCQRFIHLRNDDDASYLPLHHWNKQQMLLHKELWDRIAPFFSGWKKKIEASYAVIECVANDIVFACMVPPEQTPGLKKQMLEFIKPWPDAQVSGNQDWTFILHASFSKANVLRHCAEQLGVAAHNIIAIGDGINDISMLNGLVTPLVGCPANASREVIDAVTAAGGMVADAPAASGTLQILKYYVSRIGKA